jgi:hypothetical protein
MKSLANLPGFILVFIILLGFYGFCVYNPTRVLERHDYQYKIVTDSGTYYRDSCKVKNDTIDSIDNQFPNHSKIN